MVEAHAWNEQLDLAHEAMDHEHHLQIALLSGFADAVEQRRPWLARRLAEQLVRYSAVHFASEELLMEASGYEPRGAHASEHAAFLAQMRELGAGYDGAGGEAALAAALELRAALAAHIADADRRLAQHARAR
ncbi:MAG TPA: hemerythrin domain-containing protein [Anaeromyxobacter sp.]|nr:hemerythrin domain-containing protein [Anaeromyxobacter sp.]